MQRLHTALALCLSAAATPAAAVSVSDPVGDFLPTFVGAHNADLDVTNFSVVFDGTNLLLGGTLAGDILAADTPLYVIGINTGTGVNAPFGNIGEPNVVFNQVVLINGATGVGTLVGDGSLTTSITGNAFSVLVPASLLPSTGRTPPQYGFNLWPRLGLGNNNQISDFAPQNALLSIAPVPEPSTWAMMLLGFAGIGAAMRRRRRRRFEQIA
jgi:hypothetical protein